MALIVFLLPLIIGIGWWLSLKPSNGRSWAPDQLVLPQITLAGETVTIKSIRNFNYRSEDDFVSQYYDKTFNVKDIRHADLIFVPFNRSKHAAHAFLSFEFVGEDYLSISIEIRKKHNEKYSPMRGLLRQYELMYVIADEADVIKLRTNHRDNKVFMYPLKLGQKQLAQLFVDMMHRAQKLQQQPEFYNTIFNACVTNLVSHINKVRQDKIPFHPSIIISGYVDRYFHKLGLFATNLSYKKARQACYITPIAKAYDYKSQFSQFVRHHLHAL